MQRNQLSLRTLMGSLELARSDLDQKLAEEFLKRAFLDQEERI